MKTSINLYHGKYKPSLSLISLSSVTFFNVLALVLFIGIFAFLSWRNGNLTEQNKQQTENVAAVEKKLKSLEAELQARRPNPELLATIENQKIELSQRQRLLSELSHREEGKNNRFSVVLSDLAKADTSTIWLTTIKVNDDQVKLVGYGSTADAMPKWLAELSNTCLLYTSPSPRDGATSRMPSSA